MFRSAYSDSVRVRTPVGLLSLTKQSFADECEINNIVARHARTGVLEHANRYAGHYGDFCDVQDYQSSINAVKAASDMFMSLPSKLRSRFENDPGKFLDFCSNVENKDEMGTLGLLKPESVKAVEPVKKDTV